MHDSPPKTTIARTRISLVVVVLVTMSAGAGTARAQLAQRYELADLKALEHAFVELAENVRPSVVSIQTYLVPDSNAMGTRSVRIPANKVNYLIIEAKNKIGSPLECGEITRQDTFLELFKHTDYLFIKKLVPCIGGFF